MVHHDLSVGSPLLTKHRDNHAIEGITNTLRNLVNMVWEFKMPFELNSMENLDFRIQGSVVMFTKKNENNKQYKVDIIQLYQISIYKQEVNRETLNA
jgi:hypothetical protein